MYDGRQVDPTLPASCGGIQLVTQHCNAEVICLTQGKPPPDPSCNPRGVVFTGRRPGPKWKCSVANGSKLGGGPLEGVPALQAGASCWLLGTTEASPKAGGATHDRRAAPEDAEPPAPVRAAGAAGTEPLSQHCRWGWRTPALHSAARQPPCGFPSTCPDFVTHPDLPCGAATGSGAEGCEPLSLHCFRHLVSVDVCR